MTLTTRSQLLLAGAVICGMALPATAGEKTTIRSDMQGISEQMRQLKASGANSAMITRLQARYDNLAAQLNQSSSTVAQRGFGQRTDRIDELFGTPPSGTIATTNTFTNNTPGAIPDNTPAGVTRTVLVSGQGVDLWDVDVNATITHTWASDMDITVISPAGTIVTLSTDNGAGNDNVYNGTKWDDQATVITQQALYTNNVTATPLVPEGALGKFFGEDPNGTWTLRVVDDLGGDVGTVASFSVDVTTLNLNLTDSTVVGSNNTVTPIPDNNLTGVTSVATVAGAGPSTCDVDVQAFITHTWSSDLLINVISPAGTVVNLARWRGAGNDNVFNGTTWNDSASVLTSDNVYANNVTATPLIPEGALAKFQGENPNGNWGLRVIDDVAADVGTINSWSVTVKSCTAAECWLALGSGAGTVDFTTYGLSWQTQMARINDSYPVLMDDIPYFALPTRRIGTNGLWRADRPMVVSGQVFMYNENAFPLNPSQWSQRMDVYAAVNEQPIVTWHGSLNGIHINYATFVGPDGKWYIQYPFTIDGM